MSSKPQRARKKRTEPDLPEFAGLDGADAESAALIRAMLMQDQMNADGIYDNDDYGNAYAAEPKRGKAKKAAEEEMDDDFVPLAVQRELKLRGLVTGRRGSVRDEDDGEDDDGPPKRKERRGRPKKAKTVDTPAATNPATASENPAAYGNDTNPTPVREDGQPDAVEAPLDALGVAPIDVAPKEGGDAVVASDKKQKKKKEPDPNHLLGKWTDDEESKFLEALTNFGRDWDAIQAHIGTRDKNSIRSHAQKYFIKLYKNGMPLPGKVSESGAGYTLSGKPLDPESAAAKQYLGKRFLQKREENLKKGIKQDFGIENFNGERDNPLPTKPHEPVESTLAEAEKSDLSTSLPPKEESNDSVGAPEPGSGKKTSSGKKKQQKKKPFREADLGIDVGQMLYGDQATFSKERLRDRKQWKSLSVLDHEHNPLTLVKAMKYSEGTQPFTVTITSNALLLADLHAHLARVEIIGFLAGTWDAETKCITISEAFPCKSISTGEDEVNVEMDPESEIEVRRQIQQKNLRVVGWYHSHPNFPPDPSIRDIENQHNYQKLFVDSEHRTEPFVGVIIGTYDQRMPTTESIVNWFHVDALESGGQPYYIVNSLVPSESLTSELVETTKQLLEFYSKFEQRTAFSDVWKFNLTDEQKAALQQARASGDQAEGAQVADLTSVANSAKVTKLIKMLESIKKRISPSIADADADKFLQTIQSIVETSW